MDLREHSLAEVGVFGSGGSMAGVCKPWLIGQSQLTVFFVCFVLFWCGLWIKNVFTF